MQPGVGAEIRKGVIRAGRTMVSGIRDCAVLAASLGSMLVSGGCATSPARVSPDPPRMEIDTPLSGYLSVGSLPPVQEWTKISLPLLSEAKRQGEQLGLDLGFLGSIGLGLSGARARILNLEAALGTSLLPPEARPPEESVSDDSKSEVENEGKNTGE